MLIYALVSAFSLAAFGLFTTGESTLPITTCKRDSVDYSACLKRFLEETWPRFIIGLPEFNFPSLDPLFYKYGTAVFNSGLIHAEVILSNITTTGLSKTRFYDVRTHFLDDEFRLEIDAQVPRIFIEGAVKVDGTVGLFRIVGDGYMNTTVDDVRGTWDLTGRVINDTWIVEHFRTTPSIGKLKVYFDNLLDNKELNDLAVIFVNEFWPPLYRVMLPVASNVWDPWLISIVNNISSKVSFSKIFP
ncbi:uncharacterized protein LOC112455564 [Temnothorax curvispinosus]|uniref:Uncharacterized protein LOC112455564 n=1 Tax=Temnothorax curvispinosus TaxID=300111 RepID=A0A6J1PX04_9HYME|nr:uncharacterized protein LOC112455564 [Temnothorax curvispinosus]XP_024873352.1 uncharacterized protein LOC112455564 [Temnothorax curvispinosus]